MPAPGGPDNGGCIDIRPPSSLGQWVCCLAAACTILPLARAATEVPPLPPYRAGETVRADIIAPIDFVVFDAEKTDQLRRAEARRVPPIFRFDLGAAADAERSLRFAFDARRERFLGAVELNFKRRVLRAAELEMPLFASTVDAARAQSPGFPLTRSLAELWALGDTGEVILDDWVERLNELTRRYIREDALPAGESLDTASIQIVPVRAGVSTVDYSVVDGVGRVVPRKELVTLSELRQENLQRAETETNAVALFLASLAKPNCMFDADLSGQSRARRTTAVNAVDRYAIGEAIAKRGQIVDARTLRALAELRARTDGERIRAAADEEKRRLATEAAALAAAATTRMADARAQAEAATRTNRRLLAGIALASVALALAGAWFWRRRSAEEARRAQNSLALATSDPGEVTWRERALAAEARADKATALLRARMLPQLARWMVSEMFQRLLSHRSLLASTNQQAEREVAELAARLDSIHAPLEERLRAYQRRITELEAELAVKEEQNRALIQAQIETARRRLEQERGGVPPSWN